MANPTLSDTDIPARLGAAGADCLGAGGEATVYAVPRNRVARIMRPDARLVDAEARAALLDEISASAPP